jgi:hypothetical protein
MREILSALTLESGDTNPATKFLEEVFSVCVAVLLE